MPNALSSNQLTRERDQNLPGAKDGTCLFLILPTTDLSTHAVLSLLLHRKNKWGKNDT